MLYLKTEHKDEWMIEAENHTSERSLFERIVKSDRDAFNHLFREMYPKLTGYVMKFVRDKDASCDIVQDCFIKLWGTRATLDTSGSIHAYLYRMVKHASLNYIRDNAREISGLELKDAIAEEDNHINNEIELKNKMSLLKNWIRDLPDRQREAFELSRFEGLDHEEVALVMNVSPRTVNNHIVEAMKNIQKSHDAHFSQKRFQ